MAWLEFWMFPDRYLRGEARIFALPLVVVVLLAGLVAVGTVVWPSSLILSGVPHV